MSANHRLGFNRGSVYKTKEASSWESLAVVFTRRAAMRLYKTTDLSELRGLPIEFHLNICRKQWTGTTKKTCGLYVRPDLSNFIKSAEDSVINQALGLDDAAVVKLIVCKESCEDLGTKVKVVFL